MRIEDFSNIEAAGGSETNVVQLHAKLRIRMARAWL